MTAANGDVVIARLNYKRIKDNALQAPTPQVYRLYAQDRSTFHFYALATGITYSRKELQSQSSAWPGKDNHERW